MQHLFYRTEQYRPRKRTFRRYITRLQNAFKINRLQKTATKAQDDKGIYQTVSSTNPSYLQKNNKSKRCLESRALCSKTIGIRHYQRPKRGKVDSRNKQSPTSDVKSGQSSHRASSAIWGQNPILCLRGPESSASVLRSKSRQPLQKSSEPRSVKTPEYSDKSGARRRSFFETDELQQFFNRAAPHTKEDTIVKQHSLDTGTSKNHHDPNDANGDHPMLQQELVAEINGSHIQFRLVQVDLELLLQEGPIFTNDPMPSLIWPYD